MSKRSLTPSYLRPRGFPSSAFLSIKWHAALFCQNGLGNFIFKQVLQCIIENDSENTNRSHYRTAPKKKTCTQSDFIEVAQRDIFMNMRFGLLLGRLAILKINWAVNYATFEGSFLCFHFILFFRYCTKKLHNIKVRTL